MQNYQSIDNSTPPAHSGGGGDELSRIVGGPARKRTADNGASRWRRKTAKTHGHWKCATCTANNPDALSHRCAACGTVNHNNNKRLEKRDSITSNDGSSISLTIDELVGNLEGLEFDLDVDTYKPYGMNDSSLNESTTSRFSAGNWSVRDLEKWSCSMCTFENEPMFCACEMCGQAKAVKGTKEETAATLPSSSAILDNSRSNLEADSIRVQQEQRLTELIKLRLPPRAPDVVLAKNSTLPPLSATAAMRSISPKPPKKAGAKSTRRSYSPATPRHSCIQEGKELDVFDVQKARRSYNPDDSAATDTTFDMSASATTFDMSASWFPEQLIYPGIEEETSAEATAQR